MIVFNHNDILIKDYKFIYYMDNNRLSIGMNDYMLVIIGNDLIMSYYDHLEIHIKGTIRVIECNENRI